MKIFNCNQCGQLVYFENDHCERCGFKLGFESSELRLLTIIENDDSSFSLFHDRNRRFTYCYNHSYGICNWLVENGSGNDFCVACSLNHTIPDLAQPELFTRWKVIENAKHRLVYSLLRMKLPVVSKIIEPQTGLAFDFVSDNEKYSNGKILTGHDNGLITINISEADDIEREMTRRAMDEVYRTVLGHFRHEIGHYYWDRLIEKTAFLPEYRSLFGDETVDYSQALNKHYQSGPPPAWNLDYISAYATMHPWEDWAETWAHYLHILDTLETAYVFGLSIHTNTVKNALNVEAHMEKDPYRLENFEDIIALWLPFTFAMNSINRSMGHADLYPFVIRPKVMEKLLFIHRVVNSAA